MKGYKDDTLAERLKKAASARAATVERFRAQPGPEDPGEIQRRATQQELAKSRDLRRAAQKAARLAEDAQALAEASARKAADQEERIAREQQEVAKGELLKAKQKVERDARYAARKQRKKS